MWLLIYGWWVSIKKQTFAAVITFHQTYQDAAVSHVCVGMCFMLQTSLKWMTPAPAKEVSKYLLFLQPFSGCCDASLKTCHLTEPPPPLPSPPLSSHPLLGLPAAHTPPSFHFLSFLLLAPKTLHQHHLPTFIKCHGADQCSNYTSETLTTLPVWNFLLGAFLARNPLRLICALGGAERLDQWGLLKMSGRRLLDYHRVSSNLQPASSLFFSSLSATSV